jgi:23S rRNA (cytidine1920-2'-O)/16S rRNA (cytidine1409-2'-O)-methyltransferase
MGVPRKEKKRLDLLLIERGLVESRNKAQAVILAGQVRVDPPAHAPLKPGTLLPEDSRIEIEALPRFVSRGGEKLQPALERWGIPVKGRICLDVGASTGGFTDCLLQNGAKHLFAVDVGHGQIHPSIRSDPRVSVFENTHILRWTPPWVDKTGDPSYKQVDAPTLAVIDVSFIGLRGVLARTAELLRSGADRFEILALIKPQFEVGPKNIKKGIVRDDAVRAQAVEKILGEASQDGLEIVGHFPCPLAGTQGNREEWLYAKKGKK